MGAGGCRWAPGVSSRGGAGAGAGGGAGLCGKGLTESMPESMQALTFSVAGGAGVGSRRLWPHHEEARPLERGLALEAGWEAG